MDLWRYNLQERFARREKKEEKEMFRRMFPPRFINSITSPIDVRF